MGKEEKSASKPGPEVRLVYLDEDGWSEAYRMLAKIILAENDQS